MGPGWQARAAPVNRFGPTVSKSGAIGGPFRAGNRNAATVEAKGGTLKVDVNPLFKP